MDPLTALPNYRSHPTPHLVLDPPHEAFCLTPVSPSSADAAELSRMVETPSIWRYFGMAASGFSVVDAEAKLRLWEEEDGQWGFPVIRRTIDAQSQSSESVPPAPWIGLFRVCRSFWAASEKGKAILAKEQELPNDQAHYHTAWVMLDPEVRGNGLMTDSPLKIRVDPGQAVGRFIIDKWFLPKLHPYPGQLSSAWLSSNAASAKLHARLGFEPVGKNTNPAQGEVVYAVWQGAGPCGYDKSVWAGWTTSLEEGMESAAPPTAGGARPTRGDQLLAAFTHPVGPVENLALPPSVTSLAAYRAAPIPHVVVPSHPDFCMTQHCLSDGKEIFRLANDPSIAPNLGVTPENPMTLEVAEGLVRGNMVNASAWPMWALRRVQDLHLEEPPMVGLIGIRRDTVFRPLGPLAEAKVKEEAPLPDDKAHYVMVLYVDPAYARRGLMQALNRPKPCVYPGSGDCRQLGFRSHRQAAVSHILDGWLRPRSFPGQLLSFFFPANTPSCAFHRSLDFLPVGVSYDCVGMKPGDRPLVVSVWQGSGACGLEESGLNGLTPVAGWEEMERVWGVPPRNPLHRALDVAHIPRAFANLPDLRLGPPTTSHPRGIPHIPLPSHPHLCLTNYLSSDPPHLVRLINDPLVSVGLATTKVGTFGLPEATKRVEATLRDPRGWCFPVIRLTSTLSLPDPGLVGNLALRPDRRLTLLGPYADRVLAQEADLPDEKIHWAMAFSLEPSYFRQGIMTAVMNYILSSWFLPTIRPFPGQLVSSYFLSNPSSAGLHRRLGFLPVATSEHWAGRPLKQGEEPVFGL
ncbi:hypothetical protein JCM24511_08193 [Saitozyma sp. JCM 24511]|nr:hypothetical protein JCM24511_08193 [Saitozyma sp. JCM 24511]